jgi:predicted HicB family RNase H-like nuclease
MSKRPPLTSVRLKTPGQQLEPQKEVTGETETKESASPGVPEEKKASTAKGKPLKERAKQMICYVNPRAHKQLKQLALSEEKQLNNLLVEAINLLFRSRQLPQIAEPDE